MSEASELDHILANDLRITLMLRKYPSIFYVSRRKYEAVERVILDWIDSRPQEEQFISFGPNGGLMFKNVELLIKS